LKKEPEQIVWYDPGVGTFGADNVWSQAYRRLTEIWGRLTGWGLDANVKDGYRFLVEHYDDGKRPDGRHADPDRIILFGFSRGAYSARVLAGFVNAFGLIHPVNLNLVDYAYRAYKGIGTRTGADPSETAFAEIRLYERILRPKRPAIHLLGLFDTVASVIEPGRFGPRLRSHAFTSRNPSVAAVRHAVAIDERRTLFSPQLWPEDQPNWGSPFRNGPDTPQDVREVWFTGVHGDIGGGYPERESQLAKIPLDWLIDETEALGVRYKRATVDRLVLGQGPEPGHYVAPDPLARPHTSMNRFWRLLEFVPRRAHGSVPPGRRSWRGWYLPGGAPRQIPDGARIHASVFARRDTPQDIPQPNIPEHYREA
jgi:uncharacterized protein (DUF2235 family)